MAERVYTVHPVSVSVSSVGDPIEPIAREAVVGSMPTITRNGGTLEIGTFQTTRYNLVAHLASLSVTHRIGFSTVLRPSRDKEYRIPVLGAELLAIRTRTGQDPLLWYAESIPSRVAIVEGIGRLCLCGHCRISSVLHFTSVDDHPDGLVATYSEYGLDHRPTHAFRSSSTGV